MDKTGTLELKWIQGFTDKKIEFVDAKTVCYSLGSHICFLNLETKAQKTFQSPGRGVSALTANGKSGIFAFSEQKLSPSIFVYSFPELQLKNELKGDAQLDYTSLTLSDDGPYLGCLSSFPGFTITVWDWENAEKLCTQSQAGQDIISLVFNPFNWIQLCALDTTTLTVWSIERSNRFHVLKPWVIELPTTNDFFVEELTHTSDNVSNKLSSMSRFVTVTPSAICWTATSELYVGCAEGFLLLVDLKRFFVSILNPTTADALPELRKVNFQSLILSENGLIAAGEDNLVYCLQIRGTEINITQTWQLEKPVAAVSLSPDNETLLSVSKTGELYLLNPTKSDKIKKVLNVLSGNFLAAFFLQSDRNICVSLRENGVLQLWSSDGACLSSLPLQAEVTCLSCCPIAHYAAVGTASGKVLFIDLNKVEQPRLVHQVYLSHAAVNHLVFDQGGHYLLTSGSDSHLYVIDAKPSAGFSVIGYKVLSGRILSLSTHWFCNHEEVNVLALCSEQEGGNEDGSSLIRFSLPANNIAGPDCVDRFGCLSDHMLKLLKYEVPLPLTSCALGVSEVFGYCQRNKSLQRFELPESTDDFSSQQVAQLKPVQQVKGHPLGPASVFLSPHFLWLASVDRDGLLRIRLTASMDRYIELWCHSCRLGGGRCVSFSTDGHTLLTSGVNDGSLVCADLRIKGVDDDENMKNVMQYMSCLAQAVRIVFNTENPVLTDFPVWNQKSPDGSEKTEDSEVCGRTSADVLEGEASHSNLTWLETKREAVVKEDKEQYSEAKEQLMETIQELSDSFIQIQKMIQENEDLPLEQLSVDVGEQGGLEEMVEQEAERVRAETEQDIVEKRFVSDVIKREGWDSWMVKRRAIKAFHSDLVMWNYPLKERTDEELENLRRVQNMRKFEEAACALSSEEKSYRAQDQEKEGHKAESAALKGSFSAQLGYSNPYIYDQFSLQATEQRINQIILLQDLIYGIKMSFNNKFEALHRQKVQELKRVRTRNKHIREIMKELGINQELGEPRLTDDEWPERLLTVDDSEIKAEKYLTPEQREEEEERRKLEEESRLAAKADDSRERALDNMMGGSLEMKKVDIFKMEIPPPEFALTKPDVQWSEEEKKVYNEYEKKTKELNEEKEKHKRYLEIEQKKLQESTKDAVKKFDEMLMKLLEKRIIYTAAIYQEELKTCHLADSVFTEEEIRDQEHELWLTLEKKVECKKQTGAEVRRQENEIDRFQLEYERTVSDDKLFDKEFRNEFSDVPKHLVDKLYKLFKRRPRVQKMRAQTESSSSLFGEIRPSAFQAPDALNQMLRAMDELDAPENKPEALNQSIWEKFCLVRRTKVESEQKIKIKALTLAEMQTFLQGRTNEDEALKLEVQLLSETLKSLHIMRNNHLMNTSIQVLLKQGQVETSTLDLTADSTGTDFFLCHRNVAENLRRKIRTLAEQKIASSEMSKVVHEHMVHLDWEQNEIKNMKEDLKNKEKDVKMLRLTEEQQDIKYCNNKDQQHRMSEKISRLEQTTALMKKTQQDSVQQYEEQIEQLNIKVAKTETNINLQEALPDMQVTVTKLNIFEASASGENATNKERYQDIVQGRNLMDLAESQAEDLAFLREEVERLRKRNFPSFDQPKHC